MLKKICYIFSLLCFLSCNSDDCDCPGWIDGELRITASIISPRTVTKFAFTEGDAMGIFPVSYVNGEPGTLGDIQNPLNSEYIFNGTEWIATAGEEIFLNETLMDIYAYYPYDPELGRLPDKKDVSNYPFMIPYDQTLSGPEIDFLWGKTDGLTQVNNRANIRFRHVLSRIIINLYYNEDVTDGITNVQIHNLYTSCLIDLRTGDTTPVGTIVAIKPYEYDIPESEYDFSYESIVVPQIIATGSPVVSLIYNGERLLYELQGELELLPSTTYTLNLLIGSATPGIVPAYEKNFYLKEISNEYW